MHEIRIAQIDPLRERAVEENIVQVFAPERTFTEVWLRLRMFISSPPIPPGYALAKQVQMGIFGHTLPFWKTNLGAMHS